jgi:hypothetical protein
VRNKIYKLEVFDEEAQKAAPSSPKDFLPKIMGATESPAPGAPKEFHPKVTGEMGSLWKSFDGTGNFWSMRAR